MNTRHLQSGFTLVEVMFSSLVMLTGTILVVSMSANMQHFEIETQKQTAIERETTLLLDYLERDVKASAGLVPDFDAVSPYSDAIVLKAPEFDEDGVSATGRYRYIAYEMNRGAKVMVRTVYDAEGAPLDEVRIPAENTYFQLFVNGKPYYGIEDPGSATTLQVNAFRYAPYRSSPRGMDYNRTFVITSSLRNPNS